MDTRKLEAEAQAAALLLAGLRDVIGDDDQAAQDMVEGETSLLERIAQAMRRYTDIDMLVKAIDLHEDELGQRRARLLKQRDTLREAVMLAMQTAELRKLELPTVTLSLKAVPPKVEVIDEAAVPADFWKEQEPRLDKTELGRALKAGQVVPGARLSKGGETLQVRVA